MCRTKHESILLHIFLTHTFHFDISASNMTCCFDRSCRVVHMSRTCAVFHHIADDVCSGSILDPTNRWHLSGDIFGRYSCGRPGFYHSSPRSTCSDYRPRGILCRTNPYIALLDKTHCNTWHWRHSSFLVGNNSRTCLTPRCMSIL